MSDDEQAFDDIVAEAAQESLSCDVQRQEWVNRDPLTGEALPWSTDIPLKGPCPFPAVKWVKARFCPCRADVRQSRHPIETLVLSMGLAVVGQMMCQPHIDYYRHRLPYPFTCPGCGITYLHPGELLLDGDDIAGSQETQ